MYQIGHEEFQLHCPELFINSHSYKLKKLLEDDVYGQVALNTLERLDNPDELARKVQYTLYSRAEYEPSFEHSADKIGDDKSSCL